MRRTYIANRQTNTELKRKELGFWINGRIVGFLKDDSKFNRISSSWKQQIGTKYSIVIGDESYS